MASFIAPPPSTPPIKLALLSISDANTGTSMYERRWRWHDGARYEGVGNLVHTLLKFAHEIDDGKLSCVNFELPASRNGGGGGSSGGGGRHGRERDGA